MTRFSGVLSFLNANSSAYSLTWNLPVWLAKILDSGQLNVVHRINIRGGNLMKKNVVTVKKIAKVNWQLTFSEN